MKNEPKVSRAYCDAIRASIPSHLRASFGVRPSDGAAKVDYMINHASPEQRRCDCHDARVAIERAGYAVAESYGCLTVVQVEGYCEPEGDHCEGQHGCGASTPAACRCHDDERWHEMCEE